MNLTHTGHRKKQVRQMGQAGNVVREYNDRWVINWKTTKERKMWRAIIVDVFK